MNKRPDSWEDPPEDDPEEDPEYDYEAAAADYGDYLHEQRKDKDLDDQDRDCDYWNNLK